MVSLTVTTPYIPILYNHITQISFCQNLLAENGMGRERVIAPLAKSIPHTPEILPKHPLNRSPVPLHPTSLPPKR